MHQRVKNHISPHRGSFATKVIDPHLQALRSSLRWQRLRDAILTARPVCEICRRLSDTPRLATEVHHIIPAATMIARAGDDGFFEVSNLIPLCAHHHQRNESAWRNGTADTLFPPETRITEAELWRA